jgi:tripeptide aminopeptidase
MGFNLDGQEPNEIVIGAMSAVRWEANITGLSAHAGLEPHKGISATIIAANALAAIHEKGYFGRIEKGTRRGTANVGTIHGGEASNQVMDQLTLTGECRSHNPRFLEQIIRTYQNEFNRAAGNAKNHAGKTGSVDFNVESDYRAFRLKRSEPCVKIACQAVTNIGLTPNPLVMDAGLDANNFNEKGLPTVTLGTGAHNFHQLTEYVAIDEYLQTCVILEQIVAEVTPTQTP